MNDDKKPKSLVDEFVTACGLPQVRGSASVRRALWHLRKVDSEPTHEDLGAILSQLRLTLTSYLPPAEVDQCIARGARFLAIDESASPTAHSLRDLRHNLRKASEHLRRSAEFNPHDSDE